MADLNQFYEEQIRMVQNAKTNSFKLSGVMLIAHWQAWIHNDEWFFSLTNEQTDEILGYPDFLIRGLEEALNEHRNTNTPMDAPVTDERFRHYTASPKKLR